MNLALLPQWSLIVFVFILMAAAFQDIKKLRIANYFSIALVALFGITLALVGVAYDWWENLVVFALFLVVGFLLFNTGILGGGDIKLLAATSLWFDFEGALLLFVSVTCAGGIAALLFITLRRVIPFSKDVREGWVALRKKGPVPYGLGIAAGGIWSLYYLSEVAPRSNWLNSFAA
jgi:prepilin peptidase CpaA